MPLFIKSKDNVSHLQIRATLAVMFGTAIITGFFLKIISEDAFVPIASMCISWYFSKRSEQEQPKQNQPK